MTEPLSSERADRPVLRIVLITGAILAVVAAGTVLVFGLWLGGIWWYLDGSERHELRHALEDHYRDNPQTFADALTVLDRHRTNNPQAARVSIDTGGLCTRESEYAPLECEDLSPADQAVVADLRVEVDYTGTAMHWYVEFPDKVFVSVYDETRPGGRLVHDLDGAIADDFTDTWGFECKHKLADGWCSLVDPDSS